MRRAGMLGLGRAMVAALAMAAAPAFAVDVDRIEIRSRPGEPLLAEIPVVGATPQDLERLSAGLASSTTFARVGLPRPSGVIADLRFEVVRAPRPLIRVTSTLPVQEEFLTFLIQVDAPQGRLVREYSLALGAPPPLPAAVPPPVQPPVTAEATIASLPAPVQDPADAMPAPAGEAFDPSAPAAPVPLEAPPPIPLKDDRPRAASSARPAAGRATAPANPAPAVRRARPPATAPAASAAPTAGRPADHADDYVVRPGDNLSRIVQRMDFPDATPQQAMLALLRTNPHAFGSGNINLLRQGVVLRRPTAMELDRLDPAAAEALVQLQIRQWRSGEMPPVVATASPAPGTGGAPPADSARADGPKLAPARLEIAPATEADVQRAASGTGQSPSHDAAARERAAADLVATRYTEFQQMQQRIAELEQAQKAQQRLLEIKDRQLAAQRPQSAGVWPWLVAALAVLAAAGVFWRSRGAQRPGRVARRLSSMVDAHDGAKTPSSAA